MWLEYSGLVRRRHKTPVWQGRANAAFGGLESAIETVVNEWDAITCHDTSVGGPKERLAWTQELVDQSTRTAQSFLNEVDESNTRANEGTRLLVFRSGITRMTELVATAFAILRVTASGFSDQETVTVLADLLDKTQKAALRNMSFYQAYWNAEHSQQSEVEERSRVLDDLQESLRPEFERVKALAEECIGPRSSAQWDKLLRSEGWVGSTLLAVADVGLFTRLAGNSGNGVAFETHSPLDRIYPWSAFAEVDLILRRELVEGLVEAHSALFDRSESGYVVLAPLAPGYDQVVIVPQSDEIAERWMDSFREAGVKVRFGEH
jgi:hypothetical protein